MKLQLRENDQMKVVRSPDYNYVFNKVNGFFARWGKTKDHDPDFAPSPEILDLEITSKCNGPDGKLCSYCYKANTPNGHNMTLAEFQNILDKMPRTLTQIAFGVDAQATANPDLFSMMEYSRSKGVIPNLTVADVADTEAKEIARLAGAVSVSIHHDKEIAYDTIDRLVNNGMKQVNIHYVLHKGTLNRVNEILEDIKTDTRLQGLNAIVFLSLKQKGRGTKFSTLTELDFKNVVNAAEALEIPFGFDSCSAVKYLKAVKDRPNFKQLEQMAEPCEAGRMSSYINEYGRYYPCSFMEGEAGWENGIDVLAAKDFTTEVWKHPSTKDFGQRTIDCIACGRGCTHYEV